MGRFRLVFKLIIHPDKIIKAFKENQESKYKRNNLEKWRSSKSKKIIAKKIMGNEYFEEYFEDEAKIYERN